MKISTNKKLVNNRQFTVFLILITPFGISIYYTLQLFANRMISMYLLRLFFKNTRITTITNLNYKRHSILTKSQ